MGMDVLYCRQINILAPFTLHIDNLTADHSVGTGTGRNLMDHCQQTGRVTTGCEAGITGQLEGFRQKCVSGQNRQRLSEDLMIGRIAAPEIIVIHGRQVVVDQRICVNHLHGTCSRNRAF